jgi:hypothetical protein
MLKVSIHPHEGDSVEKSIKFESNNGTNWIEAVDNHGNEVTIFLTEDKMRELHNAIGERLS